MNSTPNKLDDGRKVQKGVVPRQDTTLHVQDAFLAGQDSALQLQSTFLARLDDGNRVLTHFDRGPPARPSHPRSNAAGSVSLSRGGPNRHGDTR